MTVITTCATPTSSKYTFLRLGRLLLNFGKEVDTGHWQSVKDVPHTKSIELTNVHVSFESMPPTVEGLQHYFEPNLPWAEDHFQERVSGEPLNPGKEYRNWPWYAGGVEDHKETGVFSHTYMERFWPRQAGDRTYLGGIRYRYGDLNDLLDLLAREPYTRQAYLPVWFPEDTGAHHMERVPCTIGYHFMLREGKLHIFYPIRSCDFIRYMRDDCYLAARLGLWIIERLRERKIVATADEGTEHYLWDPVTLGHLNFFASSLHAFQGDLPKLRREYA